ncbi:MAG: c-type cytochrome [Planctomycetales bacterium]|nr:c-type cytochrome [Planctomycetales bacterium]
MKHVPSVQQEIRTPSTQDQAMLMRKACILLLAVCLHLNGFSVAHCQDNSTDQADSADKDYSGELPRIPPLTPQEEWKSFEISPGFEAQLIAAEPLTRDPIAFAFDSRNRLWVIEMLDYSEQENEHLGQVALLTDENQDGIMDKRSTFVDKLSWPTAIWPWKDGVIVAEPPWITWYRDLNQDGKADVSENWFEGFGRGNVQGLVNSLRWGVDGFLHGATSSAGAELQSLSSPTDETHPRLSLGRRDFRIDPFTRTIQAETGGGQHGMCFNGWGEKFVTSNSDHLQQVLDLEQWLNQQDSRVPFPPLRRSIATDGPQAEVYRASPIEPWRIVRTRLRVSGIAPGLVEGGGRPAGYFTGATGTWVMDANSPFAVNSNSVAFVCDVGSNLVHRKLINGNGLFLSGTRVEQGTEFLRSSDIWFRPVQIGDGPDGALYIADMYREIIEHPKSLPPMIKKHLDLTSGRDRGRIWRVRASSSSQPILDDLSQLSNSQLVSRLGNPIAWQRLTSSQLLLERNAKETASELNQAAVVCPIPEGQVLAMHLAERLETLTDSTLNLLLTQHHPRVLEHALMILASRAEISERSLSLILQIPTSDVHVQLRLAMLAANLTSTSKSKLLRKLLEELNSEIDPIVKAAIATAAGNEGWKLLSHNSTDPNLGHWLRLLLPTWQQNTDLEFTGWLANELQPSNPRFDVWLETLGDLQSPTDYRGFTALLSPQVRANLDVFIEARIRSLDVNQQSESVSRLAKCLKLLADPIWQEFAPKWLVPSQSESLQQAVVDCLSWRDSLELHQIVLEQFPALSPSVQQAILRSMSSKPVAIKSIANALKDRTLRASLIPPDIRNRLMNSSDKALATELDELLSAVSSNRRQVIDNYLPIVEGPLTATARDEGQKTFTATCAQCHRLSEQGNDVGPPLKQLSSKSIAQLLEAILAPNAEVDPKYLNYTMLLEDERVLAGIVRDESESQLTIVEAGGKAYTVPRREIVRMRNLGLSLMPEGLEAQITPEQMRDLIAFLRQHR